MADPFGFIKVRDRELPALRNVSSRLQNYEDVHVNLSNRQKIEMAAKQSARCMDCGIPFCNFSCPLGNLIPEFNDLVYSGKWQAAYERLQATNNFPEFTGRLCPAPCEAGCVLGSINPAVTIENIELTISDIAFNREYVKPIQPARVTGFTVAVVGSGPAGLAAAQQLTRAGHTVVVYEKDEKPGGLLRYGIPNFKLEKHLIDRRLNQLTAEGVRFRCSVEVGGSGEKDISWTDLHARFDAILIATGTGIPGDLPLPGRELNGVHFALDFLGNATRVALGDMSADSPAYIDAKGKKVLIIGGGDTGSDCLGTSLRQGALSVTTLQVLPEFPEKRADSAFYGAQPWPTYPQLNRVSSSQDEGFESGKSEFLYSTTATEFIGDEQGNLKAVRLSKVKSEEGRFVSVEGSDWVQEFDLVFISIGFRGPDAKTLQSELGVELTERGAIKRDENFTTSAENVFVCGDAGRGQSLIVWAIAEGRSASAAIDKCLTGTTELPAPITPDTNALRV